MKWFNDLGLPYSKPDPEVEEGGSCRNNLNPDSLQVISQGWVEESLTTAQASDCFQFEWLGYFSVDKDSQPEKLVFNRVVTLRIAAICREWSSGLSRGPGG